MLLTVLGALIGTIPLADTGAVTTSSSLLRWPSSRSLSSSHPASRQRAAH